MFKRGFKEKKKRKECSHAAITTTCPHGENIFRRYTVCGKAITKIASHLETPMRATDFERVYGCARTAVRDPRKAAASPFPQQSGEERVPRASDMMLGPVSNHSTLSSILHSSSHLEQTLARSEERNRGVWNVQEGD